MRVTLPLTQVLRCVIDTPQVDVVAVAGDSQVFAILPLYLKALELTVDLFVIEAGYDFLVFGLPVPDNYLAHHASSRYQVPTLFIEF